MLALLLPFATAGCSSTAPVVKYRVTCPVLKGYTPEFQQQAANEFEAGGPHLRQFTTDYLLLRKACREVGTR
jgi:hypothetical protein